MKIGFTGLLALMFILLKLIGVIAWSWLWVLAPLWVIPSVLAIVFVGALALTTVGDWLSSRRRFKRMMKR